MREAVDEGGHGHRIAEDLRPGREGLARADDDRGALVPRADQREEQRRRLGVEGDVADLVDDDERDAADALEVLVEALNAQLLRRQTF